LDLPVVRNSFLTVSALIYDHAGDKMAAAATRKELHDFAKLKGILAALADAASKLAEDARANNDIETADKYYAESADAWKSLGEIQHANLVLLREGDMLLKAKRPAEAVSRQLIENSRELHDVTLEFTGWKGLAQTYWINKDWDKEQKTLAEAESLYLANPDKVGLQDALALYILMAVNATDRKDPYQNFLNSEKALVLAAALGDQKTLEFTVPLVGE